jgi:hypothetical protein
MVRSFVVPAGVLLTAALLANTEPVTAQSSIRAPEMSLGLLKYGDLPVSITTPIQNETFIVSYVSFDPKVARVGLIQPKSGAEGGASLARLSGDNKPLALMNGGFIDSKSPATPAGLLKISGKIINRPAADPVTGYSTDPVTDGFLCFTGRRSEQGVMMGPYEYLGKDASDYPDCLQGGPLLVFKGEPHSKLEALDDNPDLKKFALVAAARSFVAKTKSGNIVLGVTSPVSLYSLRSILLQKKDAGGLEVSQAIGLTGRSTAGLIAGTVFSRGNTNTLLPDAIIVTD